MPTTIQNLKRGVWHSLMPKEDQVFNELVDLYKNTSVLRVSFKHAVRRTIGPYNHRGLGQWNPIRKWPLGPRP